VLGHRGRGRESKPSKSKSGRYVSRAAGYIDRIRQEHEAGELPMQQPAKFERVIIRAIRLASP